MIFVFIKFRKYEKEYTRFSSLSIANFTKKKEEKWKNRECYQKLSGHALKNET